jgi:hypothetical protein
MILLDYVSASTINNDKNNSLERLSKNIIETILQYLNVVDYLRFTKTSQIQYQMHYQEDPEKFMQLVHKHYQSFINTRKFTDPAEVAMWTRYSDIVLYNFYVSKQYLSPQPFTFFIPITIDPPQIMCKVEDQNQKERELKKFSIENFFETHSNTFASKVIIENDNQVLYKHSTPNSVLPFFYDPLQSLFFFWPNLNQKSEAFRRRIFLPRVLVFTNDNSKNTPIQIERTSSWVGKCFKIYKEEDIVILTWLSITSKIFLYMGFDKNGSLFSISTRKATEDQIPFGNQIDFDFDIMGCKYTVDASKKDESEYTTITTYHFPLLYLKFQNTSKLKAYAWCMENYLRRKTEKYLKLEKLKWENWRRQIIKYLELEWGKLKEKKVEYQQLKWENSNAKKITECQCQLKWEKIEEKTTKGLQLKLKNMHNFD